MWEKRKTMAKMMITKITMITMMEMMAMVMVNSEEMVREKAMARTRMITVKQLAELL
jgi:hypothetical protein